MIVHVLLNLARDVLCDLILVPYAVEEEGTTINELLNHVELGHVSRVVAGYEVCSVDQVSRLDRLLTESQVRHGNTAGLLGIIIEVSLSVHVCVITDDLDGVLVCTYGTICTETPELTVNGSLRSRNKCWTSRQRKVCNIIIDTDGESLLINVVVNSNDLRRCGILGTKTITAGKDGAVCELCALKSCYDIEVQRLTDGARLLRSVENRDHLGGCRKCLYECVLAERSVKSYLDNADLLTLLSKVIDGLLDGIVYGTHRNDDVISICCTVVVEELVICTDLRIHLIHVLLNDCRKCIVVRVGSLTSLEEDIRVLSRSSLNRVVRVKSLRSELVYILPVNHISEILVIPLLDLLDLVRGTETIKEVNERNVALQSCKVSYRSKVHNFLYG